jgi:hypothetical protein
MISSLDVEYVGQVAVGVHGVIFHNKKCSRMEKLR